MKIGLYIHVPFCRAKCCYCDFASFKSDCFSPDDYQKQKKYVAAVISEIQKKCDKKNYTADTVFIGGGTPSALYSGGLSEIINGVKDCMEFSPLEFSVEANPESAGVAFFEECADLKVNRISLGLQSAEDKLLKGLRRHSYQDFLNAVDLARRYRIENISADLMLGLKGQTEADVKSSIGRLTDLGLKHISVYALKVEEGTPLHGWGFVPDDDKTADFYDISVAELEQKGYHRYEVSNFARSGFECRHNQKYWFLKPYLGVGLAAASFIGGVRTVNTRCFDGYQSGGFEEVKEDVTGSFLTEYIMLGLRTDRGIKRAVLKRKGYDLDNPALKKHIKSGVLIEKGDSIRLNEKYYFVMNSIIADLI